MRCLLCIVVLLAACSSVSNDSAGPTTGGDASDPTVASTAPASTAAGETAAPETAAPETTAPVGESREPFIAGIEEVTARVEGDGLHPLLSWDPTAGASSYMVLVMDPDGRPWWSWSGSETSVVLGGVDVEFEIGGPARRPGVTWTVFAHDEDGTLVAVSPLLPVGDS